MGGLFIIYGLFSLALIPVTLMLFGVEIYCALQTLALRIKGRRIRRQWERERPAREAEMKRLEEEFHERVKNSGKKWYESF